ncbi:MAG: DUF5330 domain-containing protein [Alphaproteobacteria bacterium]|nr:DUF5330 domain-containing protein [Alphaproteobacteria bacterium]
MRFLFRMIFWLGLVLVFLPRDKTEEPVGTPHIGASEAVQAAAATASDIGQFCNRQPAACEVGGHAATIIGQRAQDGARKVYRMITAPDHSGKKAPERGDRKAPDHTGSILSDSMEVSGNRAAESDPSPEADLAKDGPPLSQQAVPAQDPSGDTLTAEDRLPEWRMAPSPRH